jgi:transposase
MVPLSSEVPWPRIRWTCESAWREAWDAGLDADTVAARYEVSRAWVHRLIQRRRETGSLAPRKQATFRRRVLTARDEDRLALLITARPDATLTELRDALPTTAALTTLWRTIERLGFTLKKTVHAAEQHRPASPRRGDNGGDGSRSGMRGSMCFSTNAA